MSRAATRLAGWARLARAARFTGLARSARIARFAGFAPRAWLLAAALAASGCGSNDALPPDVSAEDAIRLGWEAFEEGSFARAETFFLAALRAESRSAEARHGLGWSLAYLGDLDGAAASLEAALALAPGDVDALAGLAAVENARGAWESAIELARAALAADASWAFAHHEGVDAEDLHLIVAQASVLIGPTWYADAQAEVDLLDPANGLDPSNASTWVVAGETHETYREALFAAIEVIERRVGAALP